MGLDFEVADHVARITLNRPEVMNAMDPEMYAALSQAWIEVRDNPDIWVAIITGAGDRAFTAGADLRKTIPREPEMYEFWQTQKEQILNRGLEVWKPIIAAIETERRHRWSRESRVTSRESRVWGGCVGLATRES